MAQLLSCGGSGEKDGPAQPSISVSVSPSTATLDTSQRQQFTAIVTGTADASVVWQVNGVTGGGPATGTISAAGVYTAPSAVPNPATITITAVPRADTMESASANVIVISSTAPVAAYYVSTTGDDSSAGAITSPWRTIQHAADSVHAGDSVYVRGGIYNEAVSIFTSGSATAGYITFQSYAGETAILDGSTLAVPNTISGLINIQDKSYVKIVGFEIRNYKTSNSSEAGYVPVGIYIHGAGDHLEIRKNRIHDIRALYRPPAVPALGVADAFGIAVYGSSAMASISNLIIDGNELYNLMTGSSESLTLNGNIQNWSVTNNLLHDNNNIGIDIIGFEGTSPDPSSDQARDGVISGNVIYNLSSVGNVAYGSDASANGIYVDGGARIVIERNQVHDVDIGIELASEHPGRSTSEVLVRSNLVFFNHVAGISIGGYDPTVGGTQNCTIVNNTLFENDTSQSGSGEFQIQYLNSGTNNVFENNIVNAGTQGLLINSVDQNGSAQLAALDYNLYFAAAGAGATATWNWSGALYSSFRSYQAATGGKEFNSSWADPQFLSSGKPNATPRLSPDLHVRSSSPALNAGGTLGTSIVGATDFAGNSRVQGTGIDVGAYEE